MKKRLKDREKIKKIDEWVRKNNSYGYYYEPSVLKRLKPNYHQGVNCSDIDTVEEHKVDLDAPEHEHLKPILAKLIKEGWFD